MMSTFNTSSRREDVSLRLRAQNIRTAKEQTKKMELESRKMEERLKELKVAMTREKQEREQNGGGFWRTGQSGSLSSYANDILDKSNKGSAKDCKKKTIKVLMDEPLDLPSRSSEKGTMKYIAKTSQQSGKENRLKGPKCGQCEDRAACLTCVQCTEHYCSGCFAAFHLRGALKKHRSVPLQASGPRQCMSPGLTPPTSYRGSRKQAPAVGAVSSVTDNKECERNGPEGASGFYDSSSLLSGRYNEAESAASFQAALHAWRKGEESIRTPSPRKDTSPAKSTASVDTSTSTTDQPVSSLIKFSNTISYADRLLLKQHRRTDPGSLGDYTLSHGAGIGDTKWGIGSKESTQDVSENRVSFAALYQASVANMSTPASETSCSQSSPTIVEVNESTRQSGQMEHTDQYEVKEVSSFEAWELQSNSKSPLSSHLTGEHTHEPPQSKSFKHVSAEKVMSEVKITDLTCPVADSTSVVDHTVKRGRRKFSQDGEVERPKSRPLSRKSRQSARSKSGRQSRPNSGAIRRAASYLGEGMLTKTPSTALHDIASRLKQTNTQIYSPTLQDFFMVGVRPEPQERTITPSREKNNEIIRVSNRLYQMAPRSWRPESSLGESLPDGMCDQDTQSVISYSYGAHLQQQTSQNTSRSGTPVRTVSSPTFNQTRKLSCERSSLMSQSRLGSQSVTEHSDQEKTSRLIVMDGDDLSQYDEVCGDCNQDDEDTLNQLEWELASESGRLTANGQGSRLSMLDSMSESGGSSRSSTPVIKLSMDKGFDISMELRDDELNEDVDENANQKKDEKAVRELH